MESENRHVQRDQLNKYQNHAALSKTVGEMSVDRKCGLHLPSFFEAYERIFTSLCGWSVVVQQEPPKINRF